MFTAEQIKGFQTTRPFRPFRICMTDGTSYDVPHPEVIIVTRNYVDVGVDLTSGDIPGNIVCCAMLHIAKVIRLEEAAKPV